MFTDIYRPSQRISPVKIVPRLDSGRLNLNDLPEVIGSPKIPSQRQTWLNRSRSKRLSSRVFDDVPSRRMPWESQRKKELETPSTHSESSTRATHLLNHLPTQIYHGILAQLLQLYVTDSAMDVTGLLQDLRACCLVSKRWQHSGQEYLYKNIWLLRNGLPRRRTLTLSRTKTRLELLIRTLSDSPTLAKHVQCLTVTPDLQLELLSVSKHLLTRTRSALDLLRDLIELCPALEDVYGYLPELSPHNAVYFQTILGRQYLKTLVWWTDPDSWFLVDISRLSRYESSWQHLETLILSQGNSARSMSMTSGSILGMLKYMPTLKSLMLSGLSRGDINDSSLQTLPRLDRLRLDNLLGVTDKGIALLCESDVVGSLRSLTLSGLQIKHMSTISTIFECCYQLERFRFVQMKAPTSAEEQLESESLHYLHWETLVVGEATKILADCISQGKFPNLTVIKAPCDHEGELQSICRPIQEEELSDNDRRFMDHERLHTSSYSLRLAQMRAQIRLQEHRRQALFNIVVDDEEESLHLPDMICANLGRVDSPIEYCLEPDYPGGTVALSHLCDFLKEPVKQKIGASTSTLNLSITKCPVHSYDLLF